MADDPNPARRYRFRRAQRLSGRVAFAAVFGARMRKSQGPLTVHTRPHEGGFHRLGLSIGRRVGPAVLRQRLKRRLREAFRQEQHDLPGAYDIVIVARAHPMASVADYRAWLRMLVERSDRDWARRERRSDGLDGSPAPLPGGDRSQSATSPQSGKDPLG